MKEIKQIGSLLILSLSFLIQAWGQSPLNRNVSIEISRQRLDNVLEILSNKGNFYFSYNSSIIKKDSIVSFSVSNRTVRQVLDLLLPDHYEFRESGNYIIIRKAPITITLVTNKAATQENFYTVSGYVLDDETGEWIRYASIYEKNMLVSAMTNESGFFKLRLKKKSGLAAITVSKEFYHDTTVMVDAGYSQQITVTIVPVTSGSLTVIGPDDYFAPEQLKLRVRSDSTVTEYTYTRTDSVKVEGTSMSRFLISARQRMQSLNLRQFFTARPFQLSVTPGLGTHGPLSPQVINMVSINVLGGYNGGVNGFEIGGLFNIDKQSVQYFQAGGLFNIVGGHVRGIQFAGINNTVLDSVHGFQMAGINNTVKGNLSGFQLAGIYNHVSHSVKGVQVAGVANYSKASVTGSQFAGFANVSGVEVTGSQVAAVINYARHVKGGQIGLINISDTSDGVGFGLINIVFKGYHKLSFSTDEVIDLNAAFKTGSRKLYNILQAGTSLHDTAKLYSFGYGLGSEIRLGKVFSVNPELTAQQLYLGSWEYANILSKAKVNLNISLGRSLSLFGGPVFNVYYSKQKIFSGGYKSVIPPSTYRVYDFNSNVKGWLGWNAGINFF